MLQKVISQGNNEALPLSLFSFAYFFIVLLQEEMASSTINGYL